MACRLKHFKAYLFRLPCWRVHRASTGAQQSGPATLASYGLDRIAQFDFRLKFKPLDRKRFAVHSPQQQLPGLPRDRFHGLPNDR